MCVPEALDNDRIAFVEAGIAAYDGLSREYARKRIVDEAARQECKDGPI